jgi:hypothetical protein
MFVYSIKSRQIKLFLLIAFVVVTAISLFVLSRESTDVANNDKSNIKASTESERLSFISQFGWEVDEDPIEVCEVIIPTEFDETYTQYNEIQTKQGFDLKNYSGMRVKRWTYSVKNYPGYENKNYIRLNVLVYEGLVIGGDVSSIELEGFMHGFEKT